MITSIRNWLRHLPFTDTLQRQQAGQLQAVTLLGLLGLLVTFAASFAAQSLTDRMFLQGSIGLMIVVNVLSLMLLRRGKLKTAIFLVALSMILICVLNAIPTGLVGLRATFLLFAIPIVLMGIFDTGRMLILIVALSIIAVTSVAVLENTMPTLVGYSNDTYDPSLTTLIFAIVISLLAFVVHQFGRALRLALHLSHTRAMELEQLRETLEVTVAQRTAELTSTITALQSSEQRVRELSAVIMPVLPGVLVAPVLGEMTQERMELFREQLLQMISQQRVVYVIFDLTGLRDVTRSTLEALAKTAQATRLLGAKPVLTGLHANVAAAIAALNLDLGGMRSYASLQEVVRELSEQSRTMQPA